MVYILTLSTFGVNADEFAGSVRSVFPNSTVEPLYWQIKKGPQSLVDMLDARDGKEIIVDAANKLIVKIQQCQKQKENVVIISRQAGSRIAEEALSMVKGMDQLTIQVKHIMLAPEISGSEWKSIGKFAGSALLMGLAGLALTQSSSKKGLAAGVLGLVGSAALAKRGTISDRFKGHDGKTEEEEAEEETTHAGPKYADIPRFVFYNPEHEKFDGLTEQLYNVKFYKGVYPIEELTGLKEEHLELEYKENKFLRSAERSKLVLLQEIIRG